MFVTFQKQNLFAQFLLLPFYLDFTLTPVQVYYHLGSYEDYLQYGLGAGKLLNLNANNNQ